MKQSKFLLLGLSKPKSCTCVYGNEQFFWPTINLTQDRFDALWAFCKSNWDEKKYAVIEYSELDEEGCPIDAILIDISLEP